MGEKVEKSLNSLISEVSRYLRLLYMHFKKLILQYLSSRGYLQTLATFKTETAVRSQQSRPQGNVQVAPPIPYTITPACVPLVSLGRSSWRPSKAGKDTPSLSCGTSIFLRWSRAVIMHVTIWSAVSTLTLQCTPYGQG